MDTQITLYIKTHNKTGLKYFGKTSTKDPHKYKGSGVYWNRHIKKHGYDVTTEILGQFTDIVECKRIAIQFSRDNDIVESKEWANLKEESLDGGWDYINGNGLNGGILGGKAAFEMGVGVHALTPEQRTENNKKTQHYMFDKYGVISIFSVLNKDMAFQEKRKNTFREIEHQQGEKNSQYGKMWITNEIDSTRILKESPIPDGWRKGRVLTQVC